MREMRLVLLRCCALFWSGRMRPSAAASWALRRARRKLPAWHGVPRPALTSNMRNSSPSSQLRQNSEWQRCERIVCLRGSKKYSTCKEQKFDILKWYRVDRHNPSILSLIAVLGIPSYFGHSNTHNVGKV